MSNFSNTSSQLQNNSIQKLVNQIGSGQKKGVQQQVRLAADISNRSKASSFKDQSETGAVKHRFVYQGAETGINIYNPSTASIDEDLSYQRTEKMNMMSQINHQSLLSSRTVPQVIQLPLQKDTPMVTQSLQSFSTRKIDKHLPLERLIAGNNADLAHAMTRPNDRKEAKRSKSRLQHEKNQDQLSNSQRMDSLANSSVSYLKVQSQQVSLVGNNRLGAATPVITQSDMILETMPQLNQMDSQKPPVDIQIQTMVATLDKKVSALVLKMEQIRPLTKEAIKILDISVGVKNTIRTGSVNRSRSRGAAQANEAAKGTTKTAWVASTNSTGQSGSQTARLPRKHSQPGKEKLLTGQDNQEDIVKDLLTQVQQQIDTNKHRLDMHLEAQDTHVRQKVKQQESQLEACEQRLNALADRLAEKERAKKERREKRRQERKLNQIETIKAQIISSVLEELDEKKRTKASMAAQEKADCDEDTHGYDESTTCLDPATRDYIKNQLERESYNSSSPEKEDEEKIHISPQQESRPTGERVISVDLERMTSIDTQHQSNSHQFNSPIEISAVSSCKKQEFVQKTKDYSTREDAQSNKPNTLNPDKGEVIRERLDLTRPGQKTQSSDLEEIKLALEKLELYSLGSSEDINESIEQLVTCFNSNTSALQRALDDLKLQMSAISNPTARSTIYETANKILFQFENFAEYTRGEVEAILSALAERQHECQESLEMLQTQLIPNQQRRFKEIAQSHHELVQFKASMEHIDALKVHIQHTQQFLNREASQIESKMVELQASVVKDIEIIFANKKPDALDKRFSLSSVSQSSDTLDQNKPSGQGHRHTFSQELQTQETLNISLVKNGSTQYLKPELAHLIISSCSSSRQSSREEVSILSPQELGMRKSQISTIPEEEDPSNFDDQVHESSSTTRYQFQSQLPT